MPDEHLYPIRPSKVIEFPEFTKDEWLNLDRAMDWEAAAEALGVSKSTLRRALDRARKQAGPRTLNVEGVCGGRRFHAERDAPHRGVSWRFYIHDDARRPGDRMEDLRRSVQFDGREPVRFSWRWWQGVWSRWFISDKRVG